MPSAADYDRVYKRQGANAILMDLDNGVAGRSLITKFGCSGYLNRRELQLICRSLKAYARELRERRLLLDLGCGSSTFGCWMARQLRVGLVGVDFSKVAIQLALKRSKRQTLTDMRFVVGSFEATGLPANSVDAVMSLDALYLASNPSAALDEIMRVGTRDAPLVYSFYSSPRDRTAWPELTKQAGFERVTVVDSSIGWRRYMRRKHYRRWSHRKAIRRRLGGWAAAELAVTKAMLGLDGEQPFISKTSRHIVVAFRK